MRKKKPNRLRKNINIYQDNHFLYLSGELSKEDYHISGLYLFDRDSDIKYKVSDGNGTNNFQFKVSLEQLSDYVQSQEETVLDWFVSVYIPKELIGDNFFAKKGAKIVHLSEEEYGYYFLRLGRFQDTRVDGLDFYRNDTNYLINYLTVKGNLSIAYNMEPELPTRIQIDKAKSKKHSLEVEGLLFTRNSMILSLKTKLIGRESGQQIDFHSVEYQYLKEASERKYGLKRYKYKFKIELEEYLESMIIENDVFDVYLEAIYHDKLEPKSIRVGRPTGRAKLFTKEFYTEGSTRGLISNPYYTFKKANLSIEINNLQLETYQKILFYQDNASAVRRMYKNRDIWLVGERTYKAQDTGYTFFKYMRENHPEKEVYYVIDAKSNEVDNLKGLGNVVYYQSDEHIKLSLIASKVISSHHPDYLYPIRTPKFKRKVKASKVFLQHGVMGTKNMVANYGKNALGFDTDLFIVSSDFEKQMIVNDFGYDAKDVFVTGLSRFDTLFEDDVELKRQVLIIPTWRDWIITDEDFLESEYYVRYKALIESEKLHELRNQYDFEIVFSFHPNMQRFTKHLENDNVTLINQGDVDVQKLIKESALMITDFSSVGFDFSFLNKPILYYQFDRSRFIGKNPSHLDLDNDLPGKICFEEESLLENLTHFVQNDFKNNPLFFEKAKKFNKYRDSENSKRIYEVIKDYHHRRPWYDEPRVLLIRNVLYRKFRRSKQYYPLMKAFLKWGKYVVPIKEDLVLFESNIGKSVGDSPKKIYDEMNKQGLNVQKVWVINKNQRFEDPNTISVKRLTPSYFYYLLRAKYWVNNQNFPHYIKKRKDQVYLQTWHGTPLKRMLHDIEQVHGRDEGYLERVSQAVKQWDYLISPSEYATNAFKSAFKYEGKMLEVGYPRNDLFFKDDIEERVRILKNKLMLPTDKKVILYAPTFRDNQAVGRNKFSFDLQMDIERLNEALGDEYILLLKMHVVISKKIHIEEEHKDFVKDVSNYSDIQDLLLLTDVLITDYSSVMFDFANTKKPMLFFTYDLEEYKNNLRGFYMEFEEEAPGPLVFDTEDIIESLTNLEEKMITYKVKYNQFIDKYCYLEDGKASERVVNQIFDNSN